MDAESCLDCHNASDFLLKGNPGTISFHLWRWFERQLVSCPQLIFFSHPRTACLVIENAQSSCCFRNRSPFLEYVEKPDLQFKCIPPVTHGDSFCLQKRPIDQVVSTKSVRIRGMSKTDLPTRLWTLGKSYTIPEMVKSRSKYPISMFSVKYV